MPTMLLSSRQFKDGTPVPNTDSGTIQVPPGGAVSLTTPTQIITQDNPNPDIIYDFQFWHANRALIAAPAVTFTAPSDVVPSFFATAWYRKRGGTGTPFVWLTYAYSLDRGEVIADTTPIFSVEPSAAWAGKPDQLVHTNTSADPVIITAEHLIGGSGEFMNWLPFGRPRNVSGPTLTVDAQSGGEAIASYGIPQPDPCDEFRDDLNNIFPGDFPTDEEYQRARAVVIKRLRECEKLHGEKHRL